MSSGKRLSRWKGRIEIATPTSFSGVSFFPQQYFTWILNISFSLDIPLKGHFLYEAYPALSRSSLATYSPNPILKYSPHHTIGLYISALLHLYGVTWPHAVSLLGQNGYEKAYLLHSGSPRMPARWYLVIFIGRCNRPRSLNDFGEQSLP